MSLQFIYQTHLNVCVVSGFGRDVNETFCLLGGFTQRLLLVSSWRLKVGPIHSLETSATINQRFVTSRKSEDRI
jgi:hypothetical protein